VDEGVQQDADTLRDLIIKPEEDAELIPFAVWDPETPTENSTPFSKLAKPMYVELNPGDMLYLPSLW
jgi:jumonji domain-containing protein 7